MLKCPGIFSYKYVKNSIFSPVFIWWSRYFFVLLYRNQVTLIAYIFSKNAESTARNMVYAIRYCETKPSTQGLSE